MRVGVEIRLRLRRRVRARIRVLLISGSGWLQGGMLSHLRPPEQVLAFVTASPDFRNGAPHLFGASLAQAVLPHCAALRTISRGASLADALMLLSEGRYESLPIGAGLAPRWPRDQQTWPWP